MVAMLVLVFSRERLKEIRVVESSDVNSAKVSRTAGGLLKAAE